MTRHFNKSLILLLSFFLIFSSFAPVFGSGIPESALNDSAGIEPNLVTAALVTKQDQPAPTGLVGIAPTTAANNNGKITGTTQRMEYKLSTQSTWKPVPGTRITGLAAGTYDVRFKERPRFNAGAIANVIVPPYAAPNQAQPAPTGLAGVAPTAALNDGKITGTTTLMEYKRSTVSAYTPATQPQITGLVAGTYNVRYAAKPGFNASPTVNVVVPAYAASSQAAPTGLAGVAPTVALNDGKITGTTTAMEYKRSTVSTYTPATQPQILGLVAGTYNVRYAAKPGFNASPTVNVVVPAYVPLVQPAPTGLVGVNPTAALNDGKITGTTTLMEYKLSTASTYSPASQPEISGLSAGTYQVRMAAIPGYSASSAVSIVLTAPANQTTGAKLVFTFDDGWKDTATNALPILTAAGFKGTVYVCRDIIDSNQSIIMNYDDLNTIYSHGWDLSNHTTNHLDFQWNANGTIDLNPDGTYIEIGSSTDPVNLERMRTAYLDNQNWLLSHGWTRGAYHAAYPSGLFSSPLIQILKDMGMLTGRAVIEDEDIFNNLITPVSDYFRLPVQYVETEPGNENLIAVKEAIDYAVAHGSTLILMIHRVEVSKTGPDDLIVTNADLRNIVEYAKVRTDTNQLSVMTMSEWYNAQ